MHGLFSDRTVVRTMTWLKVLALVLLAQVASAQLCARTTRVRDCEDLYLDTAATSFSNDAGEETLSTTTISAVNKGMHIRIWAMAKMVNGTGSNFTWTGKIYIGSTVVSQTASNTITAGTTARAAVYADVFIGVTGSGGIVSAARQATATAVSVSTFAINVSTPLTVKYTGIMGTADPTNTETNEAFRVEIIP